MTDIYIDFNKTKDGTGTVDDPHSSDYQHNYNEPVRFHIKGHIKAEQLDLILTNYSPESAKPLILQGYVLE